MKTRTKSESEKWHDRRNRRVIEWFYDHGAEDAEKAHKTAMGGLCVADKFSFHGGPMDGQVFDFTVRFPISMLAHILIGKDSDYAYKVKNIHIDGELEFHCERIQDE